MVKKKKPAKKPAAKKRGKAKRQPVRKAVKKTAKKTVKKVVKKVVKKTTKKSTLKKKPAAKRKAGPRLTIAPALEARLKDVAKGLGKPFDAVVLQALSEFAETWEDHQRTVAALLEEDDDRMQLVVPQE